MAKRSSERRWDALDPSVNHEDCNSTRRRRRTQSGEQSNKTLQLSEEYIKIIDSCDVTVEMTELKAALSLQAGLQAVILILVTITIGDSEKADRFTQELIQTAKIKQLTYQNILVENSREVTIEKVDTQLAANIQLLLQLLIAVAIVVDIF
ncbi:spore coat protein [Alteribacillus sp. YIM 98480]|uniref:spore coat protein n=1 Tax=Alteribacillus sp. YIM 98480 TaxID=2606599 RepID=UPI00131E9043|nr:spore coat protein [Alteribacillus sp. YIM 98480]